MMAMEIGEPQSSRLDGEKNHREPKCSESWRVSRVRVSLFRTAFSNKKKYSTIGSGTSLIAAVYPRARRGYRQEMHAIYASSGLLK